jgi:serine/threonine protein kinase
MTVVAGPLQAALGERYEILRELGHGGMATVYLAHDVRHARQVALKVMRPKSPRPSVPSACCVRSGSPRSRATRRSSH